MTTATTSASRILSDLPAYLGAGAIALALLFFSSFAESAVLHDAAHDARHAIGFACH